MKRVKGVVRKNTIELSEDLQLPDGTEVEVEIRPVNEGKRRGGGLLRAEGALKEDAEWDSIMEEIQRARHEGPRQSLTGK